MPKTPARCLYKNSSISDGSATLGRDGLNSWRQKFARSGVNKVMHSDPQERESGNKLKTKHPPARAPNNKVSIYNKNRSPLTPPVDRRKETNYISRAGHI